MTHCDKHTNLGTVLQDIRQCLPNAISELIRYMLGILGQVK